MSDVIQPNLRPCPFCGTREVLFYDLGGVACCEYCHDRIPKCEDCAGTGILTDEEVLRDDPCPTCYGRGYPSDVCPNTGSVYCEDRKCRPCADRALERSLEARWEEERMRHV